MSDQNTLKLGDWNVICDVCGFKKKSSEMKRRWDGIIVCAEDWEMRHPQDFIRSPRPQDALPYTRPESTDTFVGPTYDTTSGNQQNTVPAGTFDGSL